jgi:dTDP-4-amino-4,6-dideoxygalactose transaminase
LGCADLLSPDQISEIVRFEAKIGLSTRLFRPLRKPLFLFVQTGMNLALNQIPSRPRRMTRSATVPMQGPNVPQFGRLIPVADVPVEPVLSCGVFVPSRAPTVPSVRDAGSVVSLTAGRYAIAWALKLMGLGPGDQVLMPAYHCATMVEPLSVVGANPVFYRLKDDLSVDLEDIQAKLSPSVRAILATHYFGFPQRLESLRQLCDEKHIYLLEDCAHSYFGETGGRPVGAWGDFAIASPRKFFPISDGGFLILPSRRARDIVLRSQDFLSTAKAAFNFVEHSVYYHRMPAMAPLLKMLNGLRGGPPAPDAKQAQDDQEETKPNESSDFDPALLTTRMNLCSRLTRLAASESRIIKRRRDNFECLRKGLSGLPNCRPLIDRLPANVVPHMFPLWIDDLDKVFPLLEDLAVPMQRFGQFLWPGIDETVCAVSSDMSHHLIQLPCHQELLPRELTEILTRLSSVMSHSSQPHP